ncbi:MAG: RagB/SusD family nutrient uptake outer membrane protein [Bacteroidota bacterium]
MSKNATDLSAEELANSVAEAKWLRAQWYFLLVQTYGGATLDLGSGPLAFNSNPTDEFTLNSKGEVLAAIIQDLEEAANELPDAPRAEGRVWKASALHLLAKAYLTRAWSDAAQSDDYQKALSTVQRLIPDATSPNANFGAMLMADFAEVHAEDNHNNAEVLFAIQGEMTDRNELNGRGGWQNFFFRPFYVQWAGMSRDVENGRPWIRFRPTEYLLNEVYNNKEVDSRYDKSYQTVWIANSTTAGDNRLTGQQDVRGIPTWTQEEADAGFVDQSQVGQLKFNVGDTAVWMLPDHIKISDEEKAKKGFAVLNTEDYTDSAYPSLKKYDAKARPFPGTGSDPNVNSYRPVIIYRLAGTYLLGAEAAHKTGNDQLAADYINTIRTRAAWPGKESENLITAADIDIDFILDERARELNGEFMRWFDLTRTGKLIERVQQYNEQGAPNIQPFHVLRPIPQSQIDLSPGFPQNQGY